MIGRAAECWSIKVGKELGEVRGSMGHILLRPGGSSYADTARDVVPEVGTDRVGGPDPGTVNVSNTKAI